jgi:hypothetical protein
MMKPINLFRIFKIIIDLSNDMTLKLNKLKYDKNI